MQQTLLDFDVLDEVVEVDDERNAAQQVDELLVIAAMVRLEVNDLCWLLVEVEVEVDTVRLEKHLLAVIIDEMDDVDIVVT